MLLPLSLVFATTIDITPQDDLWTTLKGLQPGDEVVVHAGDYPIPGFVDIVLMGTDAAPIVVRAADGEIARIQGIPEQNTLNVSGTWYTLRGLEIDGGSHGVRLGTSAHATLEDLHIHNTADVGISCNRPDNSYEAIAIRHNHIHDTGMGGGPGEGMYLGCNDGACKMWDSVIEYNWVHDTLNGEQGDGIEFKTGSYNTKISHNVVYNTKYPGITLYGTQGQANNLLEGNVVWSAGDNGIQTVGDLEARNNIVFNSGASGIAVKASQGEQVANLTIVHNTVIGAGDVCLRGNNFDVGGSITIANNAFFCEGGTAIKFPQGAGMAVLAANAVVGGVEGAPGGTFDGVSLAAAFTDAATMQVYPLAGSPLIDAADPAYASADDFNCLPRGGTPDVGAYDVSGPVNPGWTILGGFKECDAGGTDTGDETGTADTSGNPSDPGTEASGDVESVTASADDGGTVSPTSDPSSADTSAGTPTEGGTSDAINTDTAGGVTVSTTTTVATEPADDDASGCACNGTQTPASLPMLVLVPLLRRRRR